MTAATTRRDPVRLLRLAVIGGICVVFALPVYWMLVTSMSTPDAVISASPPAWPTTLIRNYVECLSSQAWPRYFGNTALVAGLITLLATTTSALAGYALANVRMMGKAAVFAAVVTAFVVPTELVFVPDFAIMRELGWLNSYWALVIPFAANPLGVFIMRQSYLSLPHEYWESAAIDGCTHARFLISVAGPCSRSALATTALVSFIGAWNMFEWPLIFTTDERVRTVQVALSYYNNTDAGSSPTVLAAAGVLVTAPVVLAYLLARRHITAGLTGESSGQQNLPLLP